jgi:hypothetical protein
MKCHNNYATSIGLEFSLKLLNSFCQASEPKPLTFLLLNLVMKRHINYATSAGLKFSFKQLNSLYHVFWTKTFNII